MYINADCMCFDEMGGWFFNNQFGILCQYSRLENKVCSLYKIPNGMRRNNTQMSIYKKRIYMYPYWDKTLLIFDIEKEYFKELDVYDLPEGYLYSQYIGTYRDCIYFYLTSACIIVEINTESLKQHRIELPEKYLHKISSNDIHCFEGSILCPVIEQNVILEVILETREVIEHKIWGFSGGVSTITYDGEFYWLTGTEQSYIKWDKNTGEVIQKWNLPDTLMVYDCRVNEWKKFRDVLTYSTFPFLHSVFIQNKVWLFPFFSNMILQIDTQSGQHREIFFSEKDKRVVPDKKPCEFLNIDYRNYELVILNTENIMNVIDIVTMQQKERKLIIGGEHLKQYFGERIIFETSTISFGVLAEIANAKEEYEFTGRNKLSGKKIYRYLMENS